VFVVDDTANSKSLHLDWHFGRFEPHYFYVEPGKVLWFLQGY
jgi:hypothetical protein